MPKVVRKLCARCCTPINPLSGKSESSNSRCVPCDDQEVQRLPPAAAQFRDQQKEALGVTDEQLSDRLHHDSVHNCFRTVMAEINGLRVGTADSANGVASCGPRPWVEAAGLGAARAWRGCASSRLLVPCSPSLFRVQVP